MRARVVTHAGGEQLEGEIDAVMRGWTLTPRARLSRGGRRRCFVFVNVDVRVRRVDHVYVFVNDGHGGARSCVVFVNAIAFPFGVV